MTNILQESFGNTKIDLIHPMFGHIDAWVMVDPHSDKRSEVDSILLSIDFDSFADSVSGNALVAASVVTSWDNSFFEMDYTFDNALLVFSQPENAYLIHQILKPVKTHDDSFAECLQESLKAIEDFWESQKLIGKESKGVIYKKMQRDYEKMPPELRKAFDELKNNTPSLTKTETYAPKSIFRRAYVAFFAMRNTKTLETYLNHQDIYAYMQVTHKKLNPYEIDAIFAMDRTFLKCYHESHKNDK